MRRILTALAVVALGGGGPIAAPQFDTPDPALVAVGRLLFWDPVLSGPRSLSCGTCHSPDFGTSDALSLGLGAGAHGVGPRRQADPDDPPRARLRRNVPGLWNLGARETRTLFWDGRVEAGPEGLRSPLGPLPPGLSGVLAAQALVPMLLAEEMAGPTGASDVGQAAGDPARAWALIAARVDAIPAYRSLFAAADPGLASRPLTIAEIANALAAFEAYEWRSDDSPFDRDLRGEAPLTGKAAEGRALFYGRAGCSACHSGPLQTDHAFHAMGQPQIGPPDLGRFEVTGDPADRYRFRTPSLRNVALTAPYGHAGAYAGLPAFLRAHAAPATALSLYDRSQARLPDLPGGVDWTTLDDPAERDAMAAAVEAPPVSLSEADFDALYAFLLALTGDSAMAGRLGIPATVPSGLPVDR